MNEKVLIFTNNSGGLYDFRKELICALIQSEKSVTACTPFDIKVECLSALGADVIETPMNRRSMNPLKDLSLFNKYRKLLRQQHPDLVITYTIKPNVYGGFACRLAKVPYAINITGLGTAFQGKGILKKLVTQMYRIGCRRAKRVFFENEENQQLFIEERIIKKEQACLLNGAGVNLEHFHVADYPHGDKIRFLFVGRVMKEKGVDELFAAMEQLIADGECVELHVLGEYEEDYKTVVDEYASAGWLHFHGYQSDVRPFISSAHCFVLPSWHEGMANTNLECAASGRPVITSNIHGCLEAVQDGITGYLCESRNADDLYRVMKLFIALPYEARAEMGLAGRRHMEAVFDKKKVVAETLAQL